MANDGIVVPKPATASGVDPAIGGHDGAYPRPLPWAIALPLILVLSAIGWGLIGFALRSAWRWLG